MQRSTTSAAATVHSVLLKPTIYETFVGKTSATARSTTASPSSINPSPSSPRFSDSSSGIITKTSSYSAKTASAVSAKSQSVTRTLCTVAAPTRRTRTLFTNRNFEGRQRRTMASTRKSPRCHGRDWPNQGLFFIAIIHWSYIHIVIRTSLESHALPLPRVEEHLSQEENN